MTEQAKQARREYQREWAKNHPESVKAAQERYWEKKSAAQAQPQQTRQQA